MKKLKVQTGLFVLVLLALFAVLANGRYNDEERDRNNAIVLCTPGAVYPRVIEYRN